MGQLDKEALEEKIKEGKKSEKKAHRNARLEKMKKEKVSFFSDFKKVEQLGLELPVTAYLKKALIESGKGADFDLTVNEFVDQFLKSKGVD